MSDARRQPGTMRGQKAVNVLVRGLLRTPGISRGIGRKLVTVYVVGRTSGRRYAIPVAYERDGTDLLVGTPFAWAKNLRTGSPVDVRLLGRRRTCDVVVYTDEADVVAAYATMARANPAFASFNGVRRGEGGEPDPDDLAAAWRGGARAIRLSPRRGG